jgi:AAA15 family ATPase/GTPase
MTKLTYNKDAAMLLEFSFKNFFSFSEGARISFRVNESCPEEICHGNDYVGIIGIKGANGSGKTNILRAFSFLSDFCVRSFEKETEKPLGVKPFFGSRKPAEFLVEFMFDGVNYIYELSVDDNKVHSESLHRCRKRTTRLFERQGDEVIYATDEFSALKTIKLRSNASIIAIAHHHELELTEAVYKYFQRWVINVTYGGRRESGPNIYSVAKILKENKEVLDFIKTFIADCDNGIVDIAIKEVAGEDEDKVFVPVFIHEHNGEKHPVSHITESSGTKALFTYLLLYNIVIQSGGVLMLDEFDINLHPHILPKLLRLFDDRTFNTKGAQMIFSTHNAEILDWLGRYRCYLVNKENNESYVYRLDELPGDVLRNDRPITPIYNRGDIGGVPKV